MVLPDPYTYALEVPDGQPFVGDPIVPLFRLILFGLVITGLVGEAVCAKTLKEKQKQQNTTNAHCSTFDLVII